MAEQNNIDKIFKEASTQFSVAAPEGAWANINASLKTTAKYYLIRTWSIIGSVAAASIIIGFVIFNSFYPTKNIDPIITNNFDNPKNIKPNNYSILDNSESKNVQSKNINSQESNNLSLTEITLNKTIKKSKNTEYYEKQATTSIIKTEVVATSLNKPIIRSNTLNKTDESSPDETNQKSGNDIVAINNETQSANNSIDTNNSENETAINKESDVSKQIAEIDESNSKENNNTKQITENNSNIANSKKQEKNTSEIIAKNESFEINKTSKQNNTEEELKNQEINKSSKNSSIANNTVNDNKQGNNISHSKTNIPTKASVTTVFIGQSNGIAIAKGFRKTPNIENRKMGEAINTSTSYSENIGFDFGVVINKIKIGLGIRNYTMQLKGDFVMNERNYKFINTEKYGFTDLGYIEILNVNQIMRVRNLSSIVYLRNFNKYTITIEHYEIPLNVSYEMALRKWVIAPHIGINANYIATNSVMLEDAEGYYLFGKIIDMKEYMIGGSIGTDIGYRFNKHWMLGITNDFVYYPSSISNSKEFTFNPYSFLSSINIEYRL